MWQRIKEFFSLMALNLRIKVWDGIEFCRVVWRYYRHSSFRSWDSALLKDYLFDSPFLISKRFLMERGEEDLYTYGETPLTTMAALAQHCQLQPNDVFYELGCGRARTCLWIKAFIGCRVVGIDFVPDFIRRAKAVQERFAIPELELRCEDYFRTDLSSATCLYLYGTNLAPEAIQALIKRFRKLPTATRFVTISYSLSEYSTDFVLKKIIPVRFNWGETEAYLCQLKIKLEQSSYS